MGRILRLTPPETNPQSLYMPARPNPARPELVERACTLALRIIPNAPRNEIVGWHGSALKVKVHAPALEGRANAELLAFLAEALGLPRRSVTLLRGDKARQKVVHLAGLDEGGLKSRLGLK